MANTPAFDGLLRKHCQLARGATCHGTTFTTFRNNFVTVWNGISGLQLGATLTNLRPANGLGLFTVNVTVSTSSSVAAQAVGAAPGMPEAPAAAVVADPAAGIATAADAVIPAAVVLEAAPAAVVEPAAAVAAGVVDPVAAVMLDPAAVVSGR
jgi:hypothetical protein